MAKFLEPGEHVEEMLPGRRASFINIFFPQGRIDRQVLLTNLNLYVFSLEGSERRVAGTPSKVLTKHQRGSAPVRYRLLPPTLIVGEEEIRPMRNLLPRAKPIARAASTPSQTAGQT